MPMTNWVTTSNGLRWGIGIGIITRQDVLIPITKDLFNLSDEQIGAAVRELAEQGELHELLHDASYFYDDSSLVDNCYGDIETFLSRLEKYANQNRQAKEEYDRIKEYMETGWQTKKHEKAPPPKPRPGYVYILKHNDAYKIGVSTDPGRRIEQIQPVMPHELVPIHYIESEDVFAAEAFFHERLKSKRLNGEWFSLDEQDLEWLIDIEKFNVRREI